MRIPTAVAELLRRYDRNSAIAVATLGVLYLTMGLLYGHMIDWSRGMDWLLAGIWLFMSVVLVWDISPGRDLRLVLVGFVGGLVIEWWGTTTGLWTYYTDERPPPWILPAWPVAALTIERLGLMVERLAPAGPLRLLWLGVPLFVVAMTRFLWPQVGVLSSQVVIVLMVGVLLTCRDTRRDVVVFVAGSLLGIFLEYWGTSRYCWNYYTREIPPWEAVLAHGFASVAFRRGLDLLSFVELRLRRPAIG